MREIEAIRTFYSGRRVLVTGHTGFKGAWLAFWLTRLGARVFGLALANEERRSLHSAIDLSSLVEETIGDVRSLATVQGTFERTQPEIVFHLAAQAIVGTSYESPVDTFATNVLGTTHVLEAVRTSKSVRAAVFITSDKCYENVEQIWGYREHDRLGGADPYSASKAAAENVIAAYRTSFFSADGTAHVASARAGNVVGGGDWSKYRLVPDCIRSLRDGTRIQLRNPKSTRPWQFVLDPLLGYLSLGERLATTGKSLAGAWNFGPDVDNQATVERGAREIAARWGGGEVEATSNRNFHENALLQLDCTKAKTLLGWRPTLTFEGTLAMTSDWYRRQFEVKDGSMREFSVGQISEFEELAARKAS